MFLSAARLAAEGLVVRGVQGGEMVWVGLSSVVMKERSAMLVCEDIVVSRGFVSCSLVRKVIESS